MMMDDPVASESTTVPDTFVPTIDVVRFRSWKSLLNFQLEAARFLEHKGDKASCCVVKLFVYYGAFNALFWCWGKMMKVERGDEMKINSLLESFPNSTVHQLLDDQSIKKSIFYFSNRPPVERMDKRTPIRWDRGDSSEGELALQILKDCNQLPTRRLCALAKIIYLVRCNLCHGSKIGTGDDLETVNNAVLATRALLTTAMKFISDSIQYTGV